MGVLQATSEQQVLQHGATGVGLDRLVVPLEYLVHLGKLFRTTSGCHENRSGSRRPANRSRVSGNGRGVVRRSCLETGLPAPEPLGQGAPRARPLRDRL